MADEKKPEKKFDKKSEAPAGDGLTFSPAEALIVLIVLGGIVTAGLPALMRYISSGEVSFYGINLFGIVNFFTRHGDLWRVIAFIIGGASAIGIFIFNKRADTIWADLRKDLYPKDVEVSLPNGAPVENPQTMKWKKIISLSESQNPSEWRLAIIEADIMLDDLLDRLNLRGDTIGDKLKAIEPSDFLTLEQAWEAHKARNMIAHQGSDFLLNQRETRHIISLYEAVFKEFFLI